ncbi:MAG: H/ACA ribonucleoprotein complex subunit GAR1 [Nitrososphaeria archaeon]|jgi:rRNA processing protein Gar1
MALKRIGTIMHLTKSNNVVIRAEDIPDINSVVYLKNKVELGRVIEVFGPVSSPFILVKYSGKAKVESGKEVYVETK